MIATYRSEFAFNDNSRETAEIVCISQHYENRKHESVSNMTSNKNGLRSAGSTGTLNAPLSHYAAVRGLHSESTPSYTFM